MSTLCILATTSMSHIAHKRTSSLFQTIFNDALEEYKKRTKNNLTAHPLVARLQLCSSPGTILEVFQDKVRDLVQLRSSDERSMKWFGPTVNILYTLSATLGQCLGGC